MITLMRLSAAIWLIGAIALSDHSAADDARPKLTGYEDLLFGTTEADLRKQIRIVEEADFPVWPGRMLTTDRIARIDGDDYQVRVVVNKSVVTGLKLDRRFGADRGGCLREFEKLNESMQAKYRVPGEPSGSSPDPIVLTEKFRFADGDTIRTLMTMKSSASGSLMCFLLTDYIAHDG